MPKPPLLLLDAVRDAEQGADVTETGAELGIAGGETRLDEMAIELAKCNVAKVAQHTLQRNHQYVKAMRLEPDGD
ncbi:hypothetical protein NDU88_004129 [Pleurodeles waltl]|uniref:Uncharacterized protein n=1 Tax=Pleurodeles waltl TaxID=8319 RepID=A0AAV7T6T9_PLEWA|nr:hypothetical protein NDU88_004129 [Pleurodeles waltl]